jgi:hypothetical protein
MELVTWIVTFAGAAALSGSCVRLWDWLEKGDHT